MNSSFQNLIDLDDRPREWWDKIISLGSAIKDNPKEYAKKCEGKILATLFKNRYGEKKNITYKYRLDNRLCLILEGRNYV